MPVAVPEGPIAGLCLFDDAVGLGILTSVSPGARLETLLVASSDSRQGDILLPSLQRLLDDAAMSREALRGIVYDAGPGGFTRVRVACAVAQGIALGLGVPVGRVDSLTLGARATQALLTTDDPGLVVILVVEDARMGEVYAAGFTANGADPASLRPFAAPTMFRYQALTGWLQDLAFPSPYFAAAAGARLALAGTGWHRALPTAAPEPEGVDSVAKRLIQAVPSMTGFTRIIDAQRADPLLRVQALLERAGDQAQWMAAEDAQPIYLRNKVALDIHEQAAARARRT